jgi:hypothetical protein
MAIKTGKSFITINTVGLDEAKLSALKLAAPDVRKAAVLQGGEDAIEEIRKYYAMAGRNKWVNPALPTHGAGREQTRWWEGTARGWSLSQPNTNKVTFSNSTTGLAHKVTGGVIRAKRKKFLTIPVDPKAHGKTAKDYSRRVSPLFRIKGVLAEEDPNVPNGFRAIYVLKKSVTHSPWKGALPPEQSYTDAFLNGALDYLIAQFNS